VEVSLADDTHFHRWAPPPDRTPARRRTLCCCGSPSTCRRPPGSCCRPPPPLWTPTPSPRRRAGPAGLEDGTPAFLSIAAACHGFSFLERLGGLAAVRRHTACLSLHAMRQLAALRHANGVLVVELYCSDGARQLLGSCSGDSDNSCDAEALPELLRRWEAVQGPVVTFNVRRSDGSWVGYREVEQLARIHGLCLRTGTHPAWSCLDASSPACRSGLLQLACVAGAGPAMPRVRSHAGGSAPRQDALASPSHPPSRS
jgi:hypothetical protein